MCQLLSSFSKVSITFIRFKTGVIQTKLWHTFQEILNNGRLLARVELFDLIVTLFFLFTPEVKVLDKKVLRCVARENADDDG